jgi:hypothetical protein
LLTPINHTGSSFLINSLFLHYSPHRITCRTIPINVCMYMQ